MTHLIPGEYDAVLNGIRLHYTIRGIRPGAHRHFRRPRHGCTRLG